MPVADPEIVEAQLAYGDRVVAVEPGGVEIIPDGERHGSALQLLWTWSSPNMEFATIAVGLLGVLYWGLTFWETAVAIVLGTALGALAQGLLSTWGPKSGLCQMVLSRSGFGFLGNILPAGLNAITAGVGWFAVNSISGALALHALWHSLPKGLALLIVVAAQLIVAYFGHNLVHVFERYAFPVLGVVLVLACIIVLWKSHPGMPAMKTGAPPTIGGFLLMLGASFGYAAGWNPYASDYSRYLKPETPQRSVAVWSALGVFWSCVLLEVAGAAVVTAGGSQVDPSSFTHLLPSLLAKLALLAICLGAIAANVLNIYSGSMSFMSLGIKLPTRTARAAVSVVLALIGLAVAFKGLHNAGQDYENFLLVIAYWIAPWLGVVFTDRVLQRSGDVSLRAQNVRYANWAGPIAMLVGMAVSIWLFSNQTKYVGPIPKHHPAVGDLTFEAGFLISAALYYVLYRLLKPAAVPA
ncbi:MAG TPA: cytosine permease [Gaiellaceae bacterium]|nr:cytosine permease [Gaiellaceae bacterium]